MVGENPDQWVFAKAKDGGPGLVQVEFFNRDGTFRDQGTHIGWDDLDATIGRIARSFGSQVVKVEVHAALNAKRYIVEQSAARVENPLPDQVCPACAGKGEYIGLATIERPCRACNGSGV